MDWDEDLRNIESLISNMDAKRLRSVLMAVAKDVGPWRVLDIVSVYDEGFSTDEEDIRQHVRMAIERANDSLERDYEDPDGGYLPVDEAEYVCDEFSWRIDVLLETGRVDAAVAMLRTVADALRTCDLPSIWTSDDSTAPRLRLAEQIERCIREGRPWDALDYR